MVHAVSLQVLILTLGSKNSWETPYHQKGSQISAGRERPGGPDEAHPG